MLVFGGIQKTTLVDYPGEVACTLFLPKCNFRCPYCYNSKLVFNESTGVKIPESEVFEFLEERKGFLDGVCITGGEPTLHSELPNFCAKLKKFGLKVKLDTNGTNPEMLKKLVSKKLVDYIAMDIKADPENYDMVCHSPVNMDAINESIGIIRDSKLKYEFRTTVLPKFHTKESLLKIGGWLKGADFYALQQFSPAPEMIDQSLEEASKYAKEELESFAKALKPFFNRIEVRNV